MTYKFAVEPLTNYDLITVFAGTNDYGGHTPLGTINDSKETASFYGYIKKVIYTVLTSKPSIKLTFFTPLQRGTFTGQPTYPAPNNLGFTLDQYVDAIIKVCQMYAIPCLDLFRVSGVNEYTLSTMTTDNLHLNNGVGGQTVARTIQGFIETLL
jgi:lysophospholipase L1-like esterase